MTLHLTSNNPVVPGTCAGLLGLPCSVRQSPLAITEDCPYAQECLGASGSMVLFSGAYRDHLVVTLSEPCSNLVVRSEQQLLSGELRRPAIRKHIYEGVVPSDPVSTKWINKNIAAAIAQSLQQPGAEELLSYCAAAKSVLESMKLGDTHSLPEYYDLLFHAMLNNDIQLAQKDGRTKFKGVDGLIWGMFKSGVPCRSLSGLSSLGKYLGYVDLRLSSPESPIAFSVLAAPRYLRHSSEHRLMESELGTLFGGPPVSGTVFAMVELHSGGGSCSTAAILMAIGNLADRGAKPLGHLTTTVVSSAMIVVSRKGMLCINNNLVAKVEAYRSAGLDYSEVNRALNHPATQASAAVESLADFDLLFKIIMAYIDARCPILLFVDCVELWSAISKGDIDGSELFYDKMQTNSEGKDNTHMVVVVGYSRTLRELVIHDPSFRPYSRFSVKELSDASKGSLGMGNVYSYACVASHRIKRHLQEAIRLIGRAGDDIDKHFAAQLNCPSAVPSLEYEFALVHRDDISDWVSSDVRWLSSELCTALLDWHPAAHLESEWYWIIVASELSSPEPRDRRTPSMDVEYDTSGLWLVSAESTSTTRECQINGAIIFVYWTFRGFYDRKSQRVQIKNSDVLDLDVLEADQLHLKNLASSMSNVNQPFDESTHEYVNRMSLLSTGFRPSLLTSSSELPMGELLSLHAAGSFVDRYELYLLRREDLRSLVSPDLLSEIIGKRHGIAEWFGLPTNVDVVYDWVVSQFVAYNAAVLGSPTVLSAIASFFSGVSSLDATYQCHYASTPQKVSEITKQALINSMKLADRLWQTDAVSGDAIIGEAPGERRLLQSRVVEIVLGSVLDICSCSECETDKEGRVFFLSESEDKIAHVVSILKDVVTALCPIKGAWGFAVEIEPGEHCVVNNPETLRRFFKEIDKCELLKSHIGINLDMAHCILCDITPDDLIPFSSRIMNAHVSDHPGMHTRDHPPGTWRNAERLDSLEMEYLAVFQKARDSSGRCLPFSSCVSLELEACNLASWCDAGVSTIRRMMNRVSSK